MLPPFHIRNIKSPLDPVWIDAPLYDETLLDEPRASLKYKDDDGDLITIGSSLELEQCLADPTSLAQRKQFAELRDSAKISTGASNRHVFSIDNNQNVQDVWHGIREKSNVATKVNDSGSEARASDPLLEARKSEDSHHIAESITKRDSPRELKLQDYRAHYFNTTNPTQVTHKSQDRPSGVALEALVKEDDDASSRKQVDELAKELAATQRQEHQHKFITANLTLEGKRQAQLAGEKFRARGTTYRPRKMSTGLADRQSYHNRWAMYNSAEKPEIVRAPLTPDAKRHAQTAGDRLRLKTNRIRHAAKAVSTRGVDADQSCDRADIGRGSLSTTPQKEGSDAHSEGQRTLLQLFESELARKPELSAGPTDQSQFVPRPVPVASRVPRYNLSPNPSAFAGRNASSPIPSEAIENGIKTAVSSFELCFRGIIDTLMAVQPLRSDQEIMADSARIFQNLADKRFLSGETPLDSQHQHVTHEKDNGTENIVAETNAESPRVPVQTDPSPKAQERRARPEQMKNREDSAIVEKAEHVAGDTFTPSTRGMQVDPESKPQTVGHRIRASKIDMNGKSRADDANLPRLFSEASNRNSTENQPGRGTDTYHNLTDEPIFGAPGRTDAYHNPTNEPIIGAPIRPYSESFGRNRHLAWDPVIRRTYQYEANHDAAAQASSTSLPPPPRPAKSLSKSRSEQTLGTHSGLHRSATTIEPPVQGRARHNAHRSVSSTLHGRDAEVQRCVDRLAGLGFDMDRGRLTVYASVARGDLDEAIDIITEDQKVHDTWAM